MQRVDVVLFGAGGVGGSLLRQVIATRSLHAERYGLVLTLIGIADSSAIITAEEGIADEQLEALLALKADGGRFAQVSGARHSSTPLDALGLLGSQVRPGTIVVDCTATDGTVPALLEALDRGAKVVLANKKPLTQQQEVYDRLTRAGDTDGALDLSRARWETTCGAGLPVIVTLNRLLSSGDQVERITGTMSGTLGYVMSGLQQGRRFSEVVREAHQLGYTEPDPRDDLGGLDVARKALILARGMGLRMEMGDVEVQGLYPQHMDRLTVAEFLAALPQLDGYFEEKVAAARKTNGVLRFAAVVQADGCRVGPTSVAADSPLGHLSGSDNLFEFHTRWYSPNPLVVQGRGAGVDATAAGVLSDIVELAWTESMPVVAAVPSAGRT